MGNTASVAGADANRRAVCRPDEENASSPAGTGISRSFNTFYSAERAALLRWTRSQVGDVQLAEDLVADAMTTIFSRWSKLVVWLDQPGGAARLRSYAFGTVKNLARNQYRQFKRCFPVAEADNFEALAPDSAESYVQLLGIKQILEQLPHRQSQALGMDLLGFSTAEIARRLRVQESTARTHLASARKCVRHVLGDYL
jgi:RNA polymerase sigma factor (sigma-70 family)